ncbi:MAG: hypothetical protein L0G99_15095, partial [Propionibacteriales bacterium]|nr:hypothetical protein [Propionibacteriales bacterium]
MIMVIASGLLPMSPASALSPAERVSMDDCMAGAGSDAQEFNVIKTYRETNWTAFFEGRLGVSNYLYCGRNKTPQYGFYNMASRHESQWQTVYQRLRDAGYRGVGPIDWRDVLDTVLAASMMKSPTTESDGGWCREGSLTVRAFPSGQTLYTRPYVVNTLKPGRRFSERTLSSAYPADACSTAQSDDSAAVRSGSVDLDISCTSDACLFNVDGDNAVTLSRDGSTYYLGGPL